MHPRRSLFHAAGLLLATFSGGNLVAADGYSAAVITHTVLKTTVDAAGQAIVFPGDGTAEVTGLLVELPVGQSTGWHIHPNNCVTYILEGKISVELADGKTHTYSAGDSFAEVRGLKHRGHNAGDVPVKLVLFSLGRQDTPVSQAAVP